MVSSPVVYPGGKASIARWICEDMPQHKIWVDLCGGGASVTLYKPESEVEIYNDPGMVALFFAVLRTSDAGPVLLEKLRLTPMSEDEFQYCRVRWMYEENVIEQLRMWYVQILQCFTHEERGTGWIGMGKEVSQGRGYRNHIDQIPDFIERFRAVQITNRHAKEIVKAYDSVNTLFYFDPPYRDEKGGDVDVGYENKMTLKEHENMLDFLCTCKGQVMISGYNNPLYEQRIGHWEKKTLVRKGMIKNNAQDAMGIITDREECLWTRRNSNIDFFKTKVPAKKVRYYDEDNLTLWDQDWS